MKNPTLCQFLFNLVVMVISGWLMDRVLSWRDMRRKKGEEE